MLTNHRETKIVYNRCLVWRRNQVAVFQVLGVRGNGAVAAKFCRIGIFHAARSPAESGRASEVVDVPGQFSSQRGHGVADRVRFCSSRSW